MKKWRQREWMMGWELEPKPITNHSVIKRKLVFFYGGGSQPFNSIPLNQLTQTKLHQSLIKEKEFIGLACLRRGNSTTTKLAEMKTIKELFEWKGSAEMGLRPITHNKDKWKPAIQQLISLISLIPSILFIAFIYLLLWKKWIIKIF